MYPIHFPCLSVWAGVISNYQLDYYTLLQPSTKEPGPSTDNEAPGAGGGHQTRSLVTNYLQTTSLFVYVGAWIPCLMFEFDMF